MKSLKEVVSVMFSLLALPRGSKGDCIWYALKGQAVLRNFSKPSATLVMPMFFFFLADLLSSVTNFSKNAGFSLPVAVTNIALVN